MSKIIPFPALLPRPELAPKIVCPPYDVIGSQEARAMARGNPHSFLHITKAQIDLPPTVGEYEHQIYDCARENFMRFQDEGWLVRGEASFYVYRLKAKGHVQTGLVCAASVDEYDSGRIKRHEKTTKEKEDDRTSLADAIGAHAEPVFLVVRSSGAIKKLIEGAAVGAPLYDIAAGDGVRHIMWRAASDGEVGRAFARFESLYIADGHHRCRAASRARSIRRSGNPRHSGTEAYNFFPAVVFPDDEVCIYRYDWDGDPAARPEADVNMSDIMRLADRGGIMPPKSTWFAPKLASGLFVYTF